MMIPLLEVAIASKSASGLKADDIITEINGTTINSRDDLINFIDATKKGEKWSIAYTRKGESMKAEAVLIPGR